MSNCDHNNKNMVDYSFHGGMHYTVYECLDCCERFEMIDPPILYEYKDMIVFCDVIMHEEDKEILLSKKDAVDRKEV